ncbi:mobilization protein, partial [Acinetobacter sp. B5B]|uniref:mobilization protein n=1 Tax=Acinetobacter baretiae TaxID=2605383 RepID=UPI0018C23327
QYQILWVEHRDKFNQDKVDLNKLPTDEKRRLELNFVIPNVELSTGKRLQPFYAPVDLDRVDLFKQITNAKYGLYDPDDPSHRQLLLDKKNLPSHVKDFKQQLHERVSRAVIGGEIDNRQALIQWLESHQIKVTRQVKQSISIENPFENAKRSIRLEGEIYEQSFRATGEYRQEVQQRIEAYRGTASERYRSNLKDYQRQLEHKSEYHSERYSAVGRKDQPEHQKQYEQDRQRTDQTRGLTGVEIDSFKSAEQADRESREASLRSSDRQEAQSFEYRADFHRCYFDYSNHISRFYQHKQVQRDSSLEQRDRREADHSRSLEQIGGEFDAQYMYPQGQDASKTVYSDQQGCRRVAGQLYDSNGVLTDDRTRNTALEDYRRTTAATTATTSAIEEATSDFGINARRYYESLISAVTSNQKRSEQLTAGTKIISGNTEAMSRAREEYRELYRADQFQGQGNEPDNSQQRKYTEENISRTSISVVRSRACTAEFARNFQDTEKSLVDLAESQQQQKKEIEQARFTSSRGVDFEI